MLSKTYSKYIQSLHHKKFRDAEQAFIAEGNKVVLELVQSGHFICEQIIGLEEWLHEQEPFLRKYYKGPLQVATQQELEKISALATPNQVLAIFKKPAEPAYQPAGKISLVLDTIQDPGNLGTIIRIADWFGIEGIICSEGCAELYNPKLVQSTMGSLGRVKMVYTPQLTDWLKRYSEIPVLVTALDGKEVGSFKGLKSGLIVIGNESKGVRQEIIKMAKESITIPRFGQAESLNAAVATGIVLSHIV